MEAIIKKVELKIESYKAFLIITLSDYKGNDFEVKTTPIKDVISFRKIIFGIMSACGIYDLTKLATDNPISKKVVGYFNNGLKILENDQDEWLTYDQKTGKYICKKISKEEKSLINSAIESKLFGITKDEGSIINIVSQSGIFSMLFKSNRYSSFFTTNQIYFGFGYPINIGNPNNINDSKRASQVFASFILSLMKFYGINDLLDFGENKDRLPFVNAKIEDNKVLEIANKDTGIGISFIEPYQIIPAFEKNKEKKENNIR